MVAAMKNILNATAIIAAAWLVPTAVFAIDAPPLPDAPFFGWLAVPVAAVVGRKMLKKKR